VKEEKRREIKERKKIEGRRGIFTYK